MRIKDLFTVPEGEKVTEHVFHRVLISTICSMLLCMACLAGTTWAWFTVSIENTGNVIEIAEWEIPTDPEEVTGGENEPDAGEENAGASDEETTTEPEEEATTEPATDPEEEATTEPATEPEEETVEETTEPESQTDPAGSSPSE